ncbi:hypothetical protein T4B_4779 [Trichinella pseudospiralis]|uniref:Uncharacterized protein n=1 Tax=Trichinella pseudospiralis TaxID=6337 RepID=A0A0V1KCE8_TRIPS|nr:hypothetical protein T4B_4779 [Trichinella pseudospiralis]KRZ44887.1 hypothetical protein T4C_7521 [Trichinella pseudospiralis]
MSPDKGKPGNEFVGKIRQTTDKVQEEICHKLEKEQRQQKVLFQCSAIHQRCMKRDLVLLTKSTKGKITSSLEGLYKIYKIVRSNRDQNEDKKHNGNPADTRQWQILTNDLEPPDS